MGEIQDLRRRRQTLETQLAMLVEQRERGVRANSDALSLQRAGLPHHDALAMKEPAAREVADDSAMTDIRRQIASIDDELARDHGDGVVGKARRVLTWLRK